MQHNMDKGAPAPSPDDVMGRMEDERMAQIEAIAASAPSAERPYDAKLLKTIAQHLGTNRSAFLRYLCSVIRLEAQ